MWVLFNFLNPFEWWNMMIKVIPRKEWPWNAKIVLASIHLGSCIPKGRVPLSDDINYNFSARSKPSQEFTELHTYDDCGRWYLQLCRLFSMSWTDLRDEDSLYFIDDLLHLRVDIYFRLLWWESNIDIILVLIERKYSILLV